MTERELRLLLRRHNLLNALLAGVAGVGSLAMWPVVFWVIRSFFTGRRSATNYPESDFGWYVAWFGVAIIAVLGFTIGRPRSTIDDFPNSEFADIDRFSRGGYWSTRRPGASLYILYCILFFPVALAWKAWELYREILFTTDTAISEAALLLQQLEAHRHWFPVSQLWEHRAGLCLLRRLDLIWSELKDGEMQVRIPPKDTSPPEDEVW